MSDDEPGRVEFLLARVGDGHVAVETGLVRQVESAPAPTRVPATEAGVEGVVDTDGEVTVIVDTGSLFGFVPDEGGELVVLAGDGGELVGLRVDVVERVVTAPVSALSPPTGDGPVRADLNVPEGPDGVPVVDVPAVRGAARTE